MRSHTIKFLKSLMLVGVLALGFSFAGVEPVQAQTNAFCGSISDEFAGFADCNTQITSFSDFDGTLTLPENTLNPQLTQSSNIREFVRRIVNFALSFLGFIAFIIVIYSGFQYVTALDNSDQMDKAKTNIKSVFIGIIIIFGAYAIVNTALSITGGDTGANVDGDNRAQLASYNSAATEVRKASAAFVQAYSQLLENTRQLAVLKSFEPSDFTKRNDFIDYLNNVKGTLTNIGNSYDTLSNTRFATTYVNDTAITPAILKIQNQISQEEINALSNQYKDSGLKNAWDSVGGGIADFFAGGIFGSENFEDYMCSLPPAERPVNFNVDGCEQANTSNNTTQIGTNISANLRSYIDQAVLQRGLIADYQRVVLYARDTLDNLNDTNSPYYVSIVLADGSTLGQTIDDLINTFSESGSIYNIENTIRPFANLGTTTADGQPNNLGFDSNDVDISSLSSSQEILDAMNKLRQVYNALVNAKFTAPVITTNASTGSAPLVITFDGSKSYDPAELTLSDQNFEWDVLGDGDFENPLKNPDLVVCDDVTSGKIQKASVTCTYKRPGTYRVGLRLSSSADSGQEVLPGIAYKTIRVTPPNTKIDLQVTPDNDSPIILQRYNQEDGTILLDRDEFTVTLSQAQKGLLFEADATGNKIVNYSWRFSDDQGSISGSGEPILNSEDDPEADIGNVQSDVKSIKKVFNSRGRYSGILSVTDAQNNVDRKVFYINVNTIVARVNANKINVNPGEEIILDSSNSQSDFGPIVSREWTIDGQSENLGTEEKITISFDEPGDKNIGLKVRDGEGNEATVQVKIIVASRAPNAVIIANSQNKNIPSVVTLNASQSSDPDAGDVERLKYTWSFPGKLADIDYKVLKGTLSGDKANSEEIEVQFLKKGAYTIRLTVADPQGKVSEKETQVTVNNIIDLKFADDQQYAIQLDGNTEDVKASAKFTVESQVAETATIFFGDGDRQTGRFNNGVINFEHEYEKSGAFDVRVEAELDGDKQIITETFLVGAGSSPIAVISIEAYGNTYTKVDDMPAIYRDTILTFDASPSLNVDGTNANLLYSWDTGDGGKFTQKTFTHAYRDLPANPRGTFEIKLTVTNLDNRSQTDTRTILLPVIRAFPTVQNVIITPKGGPTTPFDLEVEAVGANDPDGNIKTFRYYYYPLSRSDEQIGVIASGSPRATLQIGTMGEEGEEVQYGICLDLIDDDGNEVKCREIFNEGAAEIIKVTNGKNDPPTAKFRVDRTSISVGESINFIDESTDPDGNIVKWRYDFDGDGSFADEEIYEKSTVEKTFNTASPVNGFQVRLEVTDDKGGRSVSSTLPIFVDSNLEPPTAAFRAEVTSNGVSFINNSKADTSGGGFISETMWDFDVQLDSDGDGDPSNDIDSTEYAPTTQYDRSGLYGVKLTVVDNEGNIDEITNTLTISIAGQTVVESNGGQVASSNNGTNNGNNDQYGFPTLDTSNNQNNGQELVIDGQVVDAYPSAGDQVVADNNFLITEPTFDKNLDAIISEDGIIDVRFKFSSLPSNITEVKVDKNIFLDSNAGSLGSVPDGIRNNDVDFITTTREDYVTRYSSLYSPTRTLVTIKDNTGKTYTDFIDVRFVGLDYNASLTLNIEDNVPIAVYVVILSLLTVFSGIILRKIQPSTKNNRKLY